ncbi:hypothetical protein [Zooshikella harenae]|uniref:Alpha/beta hydrolase n=1 Tax=Zooshikella harenae TaxID=2827238 RepID=A0ABS5ZAK0_9GAMM|nr:hypothetical protein [Zooshikella harenae]MBU2711096.1 hypothetical protein [Zooshikella harenae]
MKTRVTSADVEKHDNKHWYYLVYALWVFIFLPSLSFCKSHTLAPCHTTQNNSLFIDSVTFTKLGPDWALMQGVIDSSIVKKVQAILSDESIKLIVMGYVPGSIDDEANRQAGVIIRKSGITLCTTAKSSIISGGVDFFLAGKRRYIHPDSRLGVHSWQGVSGKQGWEFTAEAAEHQGFLAYYQRLGVSEAFYWFTLSFPFETVYWLAPGDIYYWSIAEIM